MDFQANLFHSHPVEKDYEVVESRGLGEGGFGTVCIARHKHSKNERAVKKIAKRQIKDKKAFAQEVEIQKLLDHRNICRIYDAYQDAKMYYIVMECCKGGDLFDCIVNAMENREPFGEKTVALFAKQMLSGLHYMHDLQYAHRDLKPENYLLAEKVKDVNDAHLKLIDFGFSRRFELGKPMRTKVITPFYVCPEILIGKGYGSGCDIWSLGVILFLMFSGEPPFQPPPGIQGSKGDQELFKKIKKGDYAFDPDVWAEISMEARTIIQQMLTVDPTKRPTAKALLEHKFLTTRVRTSKIGLSESAVQSLRSFRKSDKLKKVTLQMVAKYVDDKKVADLQQMFETMDDDGNGTLSMAEIKQGLEKNNMPELVAEIEKTMKDLDNDGSGLIDYSEFLAATMSRHVYMEYDYVWQVFKNFDVSNTGKLTPDDLVQVLSGGKIKKYVQGGQDEAMKEIESIMKKYDADQSGDIDFDEFMEMMKAGEDIEDKTMVKGLKETAQQALKEPKSPDKIVKNAVVVEELEVLDVGGPAAHPAEIDETPGIKGGCWCFS
jgi:calcium-dependent protein kinase